MAEHVQAALDEMIAPLLDWHDRGVFTLDEIRSIVARRRHREYALRRRTPRQSDFIAYIQEEMQLEALRSLRMKRLQKLQQQQQHRKTKTQPKTPENNAQIQQQPQEQERHRRADRHIVQLILLLWTRTLRKYRGDLTLWLQYMDACKQFGRYHRLSAVYAQALQIHPRATGLWIEASSFEIFGHTTTASNNDNIQAARILLQRGLRLNPHSSELWRQSFTLELHIEQKIQGRQQQLFDTQRKQKQKPFLLEPSTTTMTSSIIPEDQDREEEQDDEKDNIYPLARIVLDHASRSLQQSPHAIRNSNVNIVLMRFYLDCLQTCREFPRTESLQRCILRMLRAKGRHTVEAWMAQVLYMHNHNPIQHEESHGAFEKEEIDESLKKKKNKRPRKEEMEVTTESEFRNPVILLLRKATRALPTEDMYLEAIRFLRQYIQEEAEQEVEENSSGNNSNQNTPAASKEQSEAVTLLKSLWMEARSFSSSGDTLSVSLVLEYVDYLTADAENRNEENMEAIQEIIQAINTITSSSSAAKIPASLWLCLAHLQSSSSTDWHESIATLQRGLASTPSNEQDCIVLLLQLMGALLTQASSSSSSSSSASSSYTSASTELWTLLDRLLLLYPGVAANKDIEHAPFGIHSIPQACFELLQLWSQKEGLEASRRVYRKILFKSGFGSLAAKHDPQRLELIVHQAIEAESNCMIASERKQNLIKLFDFAILHLSATSRNMYRHSLDDIKYSETPRFEEAVFTGLLAPRVPTFDASSSEFSPELMLKVYEVYQVVHVRNLPLDRPANDFFSWKGLAKVYADLDSEDKASWCVETKDHHDAVPQVEFLTNNYSKIRAYCSFLVQKDKKALAPLLARLPSPQLGWKGLLYDPVVWIFFGRNVSGPELDGRVEHTDSVTHDGTWHFQLSGTKTWNLRPSCSALEHFQQFLPHQYCKSWTEESALSVTCSERDVIVINTRLWFHSTIIPTQSVPSVSFARDFRFHAAEVAEEGKEEISIAMTNVDGLYARNNIDEGTVIFTEDDMPNAELHTSTINSNCKTVVLSDGSNAVVSTRNINAGEFFCIPASGDENDDSDGKTKDCKESEPEDIDCEESEPEDIDSQ